MIDRVARETIQYYLNALFGAGLKVDGIIGKQSLRAIYKNFPIVSRFRFNYQRMLVATIQAIAKRNGIAVGKVDGLFGPLTDYALDELVHMRVNAGYSTNKRDDYHKSKWPKQSYSELLDFYGEVGTNQVILKLPYKMVLAWNPRKKIKRFSCHKKVVGALEYVFEETLRVYGEKEIRHLGLDKFGGCLNVRKMRGGRQWSTHSWGIAVDMDPLNNRLRMKWKEANFSKPEYKEFMDIWEEVGAFNLGKVKNFDSMHFQFAEPKS